MDEMEIINAFLKCNINVHPLALGELARRDDESIKKILSAMGGERVDVLTVEYLRSMDAGAGEGDDASAEQPSIPDGASLGEQMSMSNDVSAPETPVVVGRRRKRALGEEYDAELEIKKDANAKSFPAGSIERFVDYFNDRYERLSKILRQRDPLKDAATIEWAKTTSHRESIRIIGLVNDIRTTRKGHTLIELEDPTGAMPVLVLSDAAELQGPLRELVRDEVIGVEGKLSKDKGILIAKEIFFPDVPLKKGLTKSDVPLALALASDIHVGSVKFLEDEFLKFIKWLRGEIGTQQQRELAERVKYLVIGGDLVDGVGIYPEQEGELAIRDIYQQYAKMAEYLALLPEHIEILIMPGNHDAARQAEPQPAIMEEFAQALYEDPRVRMSGNPCHACMNGIELLTYHGRSLDDVISTIPDMSYSKPVKAMLALVKKRHLAPIYGGKVPLAPEAMDYMLVEEVPDIFHFGHVHTVGVSSYRGVLLVNSGTFQEQTSFQRKLNMIPTPARVPIVDLQNQRTTIMKFMV